MINQLIIEEVVGQPLCIEANYANAMAAMAFAAFSSGKPSSANRYESAYAISPASGAKQTADYQKGSVGVVVIDGPIVQNSDMWYGIKGTLEAAQELQLLDADPNIIGTVLYLNSGGGAVYAIKPIADVLAAKTKPVVVFCKTVLASAAYAIAAYCDFIMMYHPQGIVGSFGTMMSMSDMQPMFEKWGMKFMEYYATASTLKNKTFNDAKNGDPKALINKMLNPMNDVYIAGIKDLRGDKISQDDKSIYQGETFMADPQGLQLGLIDGMGTLKDAVQKVIELDCSGTSTTPTTSQTITTNNMKFDKIAALAGKADPTQEELDAANAQLAEAGITGVAIMPESVVDAAAQVTLEKDGLATANQTLQTNLDAATGKVTSLSNENLVLKQRLAKAPAAVAPVTATADVVTEKTPAQEAEEEMAALPHNRAIANNPLFN